MGIDFGARDAVYGSNQKTRPKRMSYLRLVKKNVTDFGIKILILASLALITIRYIFEQHDNKYGWVEGTAILAVSLLVVVV